MRLIRLGREASKVGADVRAALVSWGQGREVLGGVALIGCQPPGCPKPVDAVLVLPRGVLVVVGVDLPDPTMTLDAPVAGQWKADGWPLVRGDGAVNPAVEALATATAVAEHLQSRRVEPLPVGTVVAVGPYVGKVTQPTADLMRGVRILHPEPTTLLTAARELAVHERRCPVDRARTVLAALAPDNPAASTVDLMAEGFGEVAGADISTERTTTIARITDRLSFPARPDGADRRHGPRWLPIGAVIMVGLLLITGIVVALASADDGGATTGGGSVSQAQQAGVVVDGTTFFPQGTSNDPMCAQHAFGDLRSALESTACTRLVRTRFQASTKNGKAALLVADLTFLNANAATAMKAAAETPGGGGISDFPVEGTPPGGVAPSFESSAYTVALKGVRLRIVQAAWLDRPSTPDDPDLGELATAATDLPG